MAAAVLPDFDVGLYMILSPVDGTESPYSLGAAGVVTPALQLLLCLSLQLIAFALFELVCTP